MSVFWTTVKSAVSPIIVIRALLTTVRRILLILQLQTKTQTA